MNRETDRLYIRSLLADDCQELLRFIKLSDNVKEFTAGTALKNIPSCKLLKRLGFTLQETEVLSFHKGNAGKELLFEGGIFKKQD